MDRREATVTIGVPALNAARYLGQCIESLLAQTHESFAILVADNASTDDTEELVRRYSAMDSRVRYHRHPSNIGMYRNMDFLLRSATTPYVKLSNADDFWAPEMLRAAVEVLESDASVELAYPMLTLVDANGSPTQRYGQRLHLMEPDPAVRFRRVLDELGLVSQLMGVMRTATIRRMRPLRNIPGEDLCFVCELSLFGKLFQTDNYHYFRRMHERSSSFRRDSREHQVKHVLEEGAGRVILPTWRLHMGLMARVMKSPVPASVKTDLLTHLGRRMLSDRQKLGREILQWG